MPARKFAACFERYAGSFQQSSVIPASLRIRAAFRHLLCQHSVTQNMVLRSLKQQQRSLIKVILRLLQTMRSHLRYQFAKPVIQQAWIINNDMSLTFVGLVNAKIWVLTAALTSSVIDR